MIHGATRSLCLHAMGWNEQLRAQHHNNNDSRYSRAPQCSARAPSRSLKAFHLLYDCDHNMLVGLFTLHVVAKLPGSLHHCSDIMVELEDARPNAKRARTGDTSVDVHGAEAPASAEQQTNDAAGPSQQQHASRTFGAGMQGPAGVRTDFPPAEDESNALGDFEPGAMERPEGIVSPEGPLDGPDLEGTAEAEEAAARAHKRSDDPDDVLDALEAAEAKYDEAHPEEATGNTGEALAEAQAKGPGTKGPVVSASASGSPRVPAHASNGIDQEIRDHAQSRITAALQENNHVQKSSINRAAMDVEQLCYNRATESDNARTMYHNLMANATRLAKSEKDVQDIARIAAGEPDKVAKGEMTKGQKAGDVTAGLQGFVDKPRHAVG